MSDDNSWYPKMRVPLSERVEQLERELQAKKLLAEQEAVELKRQVDAARLKKELATLENNPGTEARNGEPLSLVNWSGTQIDLGRWILDAYAVGNIEAETARQALMRTVEHFTINGRPVNAKSLDAELRKQDAYKPAEEGRRTLRIV